MLLIGFELLLCKVLEEVVTRASFACFALLVLFQEVKNNLLVNDRKALEMHVLDVAIVTCAVENLIFVFKGDWRKWNIFGLTRLIPS